jgi:hypothetical protein
MAEQYAPTDDEVVACFCAGMAWNWENAERFDLWNGMRYWAHGAAMAMTCSGRDRAREDFEFLRDICAIRDEMRKQKIRDGENVA